MRPTLLLLLAACHRDPDPSAPSLLGVPETARYVLPALRGEVQVLRTEANVPHVYAADDTDAARAIGFLYAKDRFFLLDVARRLADGRLSDLLGDLALAADADARLQGMTEVATGLDERAGPRLGAMLDGYAEGINAWLEVARAGGLPLPAEYAAAAPLVGADQPVELLQPFTRHDVAAVLTTIVYQLSFEARDLERSAVAATLPALFPEGTPDREARQAAALAALGAHTPLFDTSSAPGFSAGGPAGPPPRPPLPPDLLLRAAASANAALRRLGVHPGEERGSNAWAVMGDHTRDGRTLLAGDGHLPLSVPSLFWQVGVDTTVLGDGDTTLLGLALPGLPFLGVGTNGSVAWSLTRLYSDTTDWYAEQLTLDPAGQPISARFQGQDVPLIAWDEDVVIANVPALGSAGRTETFRRWTTADGRRIVSIEGPLVEPGTPGAVRTQDGLVLPGDADGDGIVSAISFDWVGLDPLGLLHAFDAFGHAGDLAVFRDATRWLNGYAQNTVAADVHGDVLYTAYGALPCRNDRRAPDGTFLDGGHPLYVVDGAQFGGFTIPVDDDLRVQDGGAGTTCSVPADQQPSALSPDRGFVANANQDPASISHDGDLGDDGAWIGGPWDAGYRGRRIDERLTALDGAADAAAMSELQADHQDAWGRVLTPALLAALDAGATGDDPGAADAWAADPRLAELRSELEAWAAGGFHAASGVEAPWHTPAAADGADSAATVTFHTWVGVFTAEVLGDEGLPDALWQPGRSDGIQRELVRLVRDDVPAVAAQPGLLPDPRPRPPWADVMGTPAVETWQELAVRSLTVALDLLEGPPTGPGEGGFGTSDRSQWRWGLRHLVLFESVLADFLGDDPLLSILTRSFAITPDVLPMGGELDDLPGFPRPGADDSVDAAGAGFQTSAWRYTSGPVFRMVIALGADGVSGVNVLPGGQSALPGDPHFADQAALWLGNDALPLRFSVDEVIDGASGREVLTPR